MSKKISSGVIIACLMLIGVWLVAYRAVVANEELNLQKSAKKASDLAQLFEEESNLKLRYIDGYLLALRHNLKTGNNAPENLQVHLANVPYSNKAISYLTHMDEKGQVATKTSPQSHRIPTSIRADILAFHKLHQDRLHISLPARQSNEAPYYFWASRRLNAPNGQLKLIIVAALPLPQFTDFFKALKIGPNSSATLVGTDKKIRARSSYGRIGPGQDISKSRIWRELAQSDIGLYKQTSVVDQITRYYAYRKLEKYPLIVAIGVAHSDVAHQADNAARNYYLNASLLSAAILLLTGLFWRDARNVTQLEISKDALAASAKQLRFQRKAMDQHAIISMADRKGEIIYANDLFCEISGYSRDELIGQNHRIVRSGQHDKAFFRHLWREISSGRTWHGTIENRSKSGKTYWVKTTIVPFLDASGRPDHYLSIRTDVTQQIQSQEQLKQINQDLDQIVEQRTRLLSAAEHSAKSAHRTISNIIVSVDQGVVQITADGQIAYWNERFLNLFGLQEGQIAISPSVGAVAKLLADRLDVSTQRNNGRFFDKFLSHKEEARARYEVSLQTGRVLDCRQRRNEFGETIITFTDITEQKKHEQELMIAKQNAENADAHKSQFLANMSHEIRTPMNGIVGMAELLRETELDSEQNRKLSTIQNSAYSLLQIIDDILDLSKIEAGHLQIEYIDVNLGDIVNNTAETLAPIVHNNNVCFRCFIDPALPKTISSDPTRLRQMLLNLVSNAIKFSKKSNDELPGNVILDIKKSARDRISFSIRDDGIGMDKPTLRRLFKPFMQADGSNTRKFGGTGLGLSITHNITRLMQGSLEVDSKLGQGTCFTLSLPLYPVRQQPDETNLEDLSVHLACNDVETSNYIISIFKNAGAQVSVHDSLETLKEATEGKKDALAITNLAITRDRNGSNQHLLLQDIAAQVPTVLLNSNYTQHEGLLGPQLYALNYLPLNYIELLAATRLLLGLEGETGLSGQSRDRTGTGTGTGTAQAPCLSSKRILLVEDNPTNQDVISSQVGLIGPEVEIAENGLEGLARWREQDFDLILLDCHMPGMDGYEMAKQVRALEGGCESDKAIPIIAITASAVKGELQKCLDAGMDAHLPKPVTLVKLRETLSHWLH